MTDLPTLKSPNTSMDITDRPNHTQGALRSLPDIEDRLDALLEDLVTKLQPILRQAEDNDNSSNTPTPEMTYLASLLTDHVNCMYVRLNYLDNILRRIEL